MAKTSADRLAIIGRDVSSSLLVNSLLQQNYGNFELLPSTFDHQIRSKPQWTLLPHYEPSTAEPVFPLNFDNAFLIHKNHIRIPLSQALAGSCDSWPKALLQKALAIGLWSDTSPEYWNGSDPNYKWVEQTPHALKNPRKRHACLVEKNSYHQYVSEKITGRHREQDCYVENIEEKYNKALIHFNAPHGVSDYSKVIWTQKNDFQKNVVAKWKILGGWVGEERVTALPLYSVWLDSHDYLMSTGLIANQDLKIVYCMPNYEGKCWLQIQYLQMNPEEEMSCNLNFLSRLCPLLKNDETVDSYNDILIRRSKPELYEIDKYQYLWNFNSLYEVRSQIPKKLLSDG